ncbi:LOW QUALITY PROTEIN: carbonic anhydrase 15-like [Megaptera novaeangliae]
MRSPDLALAFLAVPLVVRADSEGAWCYDSQDAKCGPTHWKEMAPACGGPGQSPINIDLHRVQWDPTLGPFIFQGYDSAPPGPWTLENDGHAVLCTDTGPQSLLEMQGARLPPPAYRALQLHFHWGGPGRAGSEHSLDGQHHPMEMHVVHMNTRYQSIGEAQGHPDGLAVLAVLLTDQDSENANFSGLSGLKNVSARGASVNLASTFPLASLLLGASGLSRFYRYAGSLTTRCCEPVVLWTVFEDAVPIGRAQVAQFRIVAQAGPPPGSRPAPLTEDLRPQQPLGLRRVVAFPSASVRAAAPTPTRGHGALLGLGLSLWL